MSQKPTGSKVYEQNNLGSVMSLHFQQALEFKVSSWNRVQDMFTNLAHLKMRKTPKLYSKPRVTHERPNPPQACLGTAEYFKRDTGGTLQEGALTAPSKTGLSIVESIPPHISCWFLLL